MASERVKQLNSHSSLCMNMGRGPREPGPGSKYSLISQPVIIHHTDSYANTSFHPVISTESRSQLKKLCDEML